MVATLIASSWLGSGVRAQVSPGPLSKAHADFDGNLGCAKCHGKGEGVMDQKCLACHGEIAATIAKRTGFHGREARANCARCHPDHGGRDFAMVAWPGGSEEKFDHAKTGFALTGKHATTECKQCHSSKNMKGEVAALVKRDKRGHSWMGLDQSCATCHDDVHKGSFGKDCETCHTTTAFRPVTTFDHARTKFALTGKHAKVACASCHEAAHLTLKHDAKGRPIPLYKPLPHAECSACHADPHKGSFGPACSRCHSTADFHRVEAANFDHDRTRYPLRGKHASLSCASCHDEKKAWGKKPPFATCGGCHQDAHAGQATLAGKPVDCAACHDVAGFAPSTFDVARHAKTPFALAGRHAVVACAKCHGGELAAAAAKTADLGRARVFFHPRHGRCVDCHRDPHAGRFAPGGERARSNDCLECHGLDAFKPSKMDVAAHERARFPLEGAHRAVPCFACHKELASNGAQTAAVGGARTLAFHIDERACGDCHESPHGAQFDRRKDGGACESCHDVARFKPASRFDHSKVKTFPLDGAHRKVACVSCHPTVTPSGGKPMTLFKPVSSRCEDCHTGSGGLKGRS
jgi:hypothetical protein